MTSDWSTFWLTLGDESYTRTARNGNPSAKGEILSLEVAIAVVVLAICLFTIFFGGKRKP